MRRIDKLRERSTTYALERIYLQEQVHEPKKGDTMSCLICKRKVHALNNGKGPLTCCDQPMVKSKVPVTEAGESIQWWQQMKKSPKPRAYVRRQCFLSYKTGSPIYKQCLKDGYKAVEKLKQANGNIRKAVALLKEAGFETKPKGWSDKSVKKYSKTFSSKMKGNVKSKDFFDKCVKKMQGKIDSPEGFCASLKDEAHGSTYWRVKGKKPAEVKKDVARHKNV